MHGLDTDLQVFFYEQEFYVLSNFSAFQVLYQGLTFPTSEHAYHWAKFQSMDQKLRLIAESIRTAPSAHEAFVLAQKNKEFVRSDWDTIKFGIMKNILYCKYHQHEYVRRKLHQTGTRELIENSWRDNVWGWGPDKNGQNRLGKLWMEIRDETKTT
jgi:ribA/ribD-fused uncharacterized protein